MGRVDARAICARVDLVAVVARYVKLRQSGPEYTGLCPFHAERTPSFTVNPRKGFVHCFGCGAHHDVIGFVMRLAGVDFREAVRQLDSGALADADASARRAPVEYLPDIKWLPLMPVPDDAPELVADEQWTVPILNPKPRPNFPRGKMTRLKYQRLDAYRDAEGRLLGYVARAEIRDRDTRQPKKWTPQITWCVSPSGARQWCLHAFPDPRPLLGLDDLAAKPEAPVLIVEGEKCRAAGAGAWPQYAVVSWPGGTNGLHKVDWTPLAGRDVVLWPDADEVGQRAMLGFENDAGDVRLGVGSYLHRVGVRRIRYVDTSGRPKGWDVADAFDVDGWTPQQAAAWVASRLCETVTC
jgi:DNA primase